MTDTFLNPAEIVCGQHYTMFLKKDGTVYGCGSNYLGELGLGNIIKEITYPTQIEGISDVAKIICGNAYTIFLKKDGTVYGCGCNYYGELGLGDTANRYYPTQINITDIIEIICGGSYTILLKKDGTVYGCGDNEYGQLGLGDTANRYYITKINISDVAGITCGSFHTMFLKKDGTVWACGRNDFNQLGLGDTINRTFPTQINISDVYKGGSI